MVSRTRSRRRLLRSRRTAPMRRKLGKDGLRGEAGLEPVDGDVVCLGANLEQESLSAGGRGMGRDTAAAEGERVHHTGRRHVRHGGVGGRHGLEASGRAQGEGEQKTRKPGGDRRKRRLTKAWGLQGTPQGGTTWCRTPSPRRRGRPPPWGWSRARGGPKEAAGARGLPTHRARREFFMERWNRSTIPLDSGW